MSVIPKYQEIMDYIQEGIKSGTFTPDTKLPTEERLSDMFSASRPTVVKAMEHLKEMGIIYRVQGSGSFVSSVDKSAEMNSSHIISLIFPFAQYRDSARIDEMNILKGIVHRLNKHGYYTMIHYCNDDGESFIETFNSVKKSISVGIIAYVAKGLIECPEIYELFSEEMPFVLIDKSITGANFPCVQSDNVAGGQMAAKHLVESGYTNIYFLSDYNLTYNESFRERYVGFCQGVRLCGSTAHFGHYMMNPLDNDISELEKTASQIIAEKKHGERIGLFCTSDYLAEKVYNTFRRKNVRIPEDYGIIGFDGMGIKLNGDISLTTISQDFYNIGKVASETILKILENSRVPHDSVKLPVKIIQGDTTSRK